MESPHIIKSVGLGSCVAVALYDTRRRTGGLAHIMLPEIKETRSSEQRECGIRNAEFGMKDFNSAFLTPHSVNSAFQCADTAIPALLELMRKTGSDRQNIAAKIAGGARMFSHYEGVIAGIGKQNIMSIRELLKRERIPLISEDTGGAHGRSVEFHLDSGRVIVKAIGREDREI